MIDIVLHVEGKTFPANKQGNLLRGTVNMSGVARSVVQGLKTVPITRVTTPGLLTSLFSIPLNKLLC